VNALIRQFDQAKQMMAKMQPTGRHGRMRVPFM
jgi:signal recognition particle GTPase